MTESTNPPASPDTPPMGVAARAKSGVSGRKFRQTLRRSPALTFGTCTVLLLGVLALLAPVLAPFDPLAVDVLNRFRTPDATHWFGTDELGRDLYSRSLFGARISLLTGLLAVIGASAVGVPLGLIAGFRGRLVDAVIMRVIDVQFALPGILLAMMIIVIVGRSFISTVIAVAVASVPAFARITRAATLAIREEEYVTAVKALGAGSSYTMFRTILPNALSPIIVQMVITASVAVLLEAALSFLGLGTVPPAPSWGDMLRSAKSHLYEAPLYALFPGALLTLTVVSLDLIGMGLQKLRGSSASFAADLETRG